MAVTPKETTSTSTPKATTKKETAKPVSIVVRCKYGKQDVIKAIEDVTKDDLRLRKLMLGMGFKESRFDACAVGDNGNAIGAFQIWYKLHKISKEAATNPVFAAKWTKDRLIAAGYKSGQITLAIQQHNGLVKCRKGQPCSNGFWTGYAESVKQLAKKF